MCELAAPDKRVEMTLTIEGAASDLTPMLARLASPAFGSFAPALPLECTLSAVVDASARKGAEVGAPVLSADDLLCRGAFCCQASRTVGLLED